MNGSIAQARASGRFASPSRRRMVPSLTVAQPGPSRPSASRWIPVPDVPVRPVLSASAFFGRRHPETHCVLDQGQRLEVSAGRVAIARALEMMGLAPGDRVLVPAYHCASMIDPLAWTSAEPVFYRIKADLMVDEADLETKIDPRTRAVMVTHYFGFPQNLERIRDLCDRHGLFLIEDCAHSLYGSVNGRPIGSVGDFAITSLTKFLPVSEGGALVTKDPRIGSLSLRQQALKASLMEAFGVLQEATYYNRLAMAKPLVRVAELAKSILPPRLTSATITSSFRRV